MNEEIKRLQSTVKVFEQLIKDRDTLIATRNDCSTKLQAMAPQIADARQQMLAARVALREALDADV